MKEESHPDQNFNDEETILEIQYNIVIKKGDLNSNEIKRDFLKMRFYEGFYDNYPFNNPMYDIINRSFKRHFKFLGNSRAYLTNYREKEGSLEISFLILIICNYGGIRETIDYFNQDLEHYFHSDSNFDISIDNKTKSRKRSKFSKKIVRTISSLEKQNRRLQRLTYLAFFLSIAIGTYLVILTEKIVDLNDIEKTIDEKIEKNNFQTKLNYIYESEVSKNKKQSK